jgi:hypothetical protein
VQVLSVESRNGLSRLRDIDTDAAGNGLHLGLRKHAKNCGPLGLGGRHVLLNGGIENSLRRGGRLRVGPWDSGDKDEQNRENGRGLPHAVMASC